MKVIVFIITLFAFAFCDAQIKPKTYTQPAKPSKEVTLNYINEKIKRYSVQYKKETINWGTINYNDGSSRTHQTNDLFTASGYRVFEADGTLFLQCTFTHRTVSNLFEKKDETYSWVSTAPFASFRSVEVLRARTNGSEPIVSEDGSTYKSKTVYENDYLRFSFNSKCVLNKLGDNSTQYVNFFSIAFREGEDNLLEKLKKAFQNLLIDYPKPAGDPFDN